MVEWQIVDVVSEGILQFISDGCETDDDVCCCDCAGDGDPAESAIELEGKEVDVEEHDLGDQDVVAEGERGREDTFGGGLGVCEGRKGCHCSLISFCHLILSKEKRTY